MNFFSSVFSAAADEERGEEGEEAAAEQGEEGEGAYAGGGWSFGGLIKTLAEEIDVRPRDEQEAAEAEEGEREGGEEEEEADAGGGWIFGGLIKTLAEEIEEQRKVNSQLEAEEEAAAAAAAAAAEEEGGETGSGDGGEWSFGGLIQTFASRSESVLEGYRRDIQDLGSGLRLETASLRAAAARAAAAFPGALEAGASAASNRLESVGQAVDDLGAAAAVLLSHANEALRSVDADGEDGAGDGSSHPSDSASASGASWRASLPSKKYTRFEAQVLALRADPATFTEEPEDADGFAKWRDAFRIDERKEEIEGVLKESPGLESFVERLVPSVVDYDMFWCRYFFAVDKLRQAEDVRTKLVTRAMSKEDEEELSWDVDDDEDDDNGDHKEGANTMVKKKEEQIEDPVSHKTQDDKQGADALDVSEDKKTTLSAEKGGNGESKDEVATPKSSNDMGREEKIDTGDSSKESEFSAASHPSAQEEDLSWEEIEDVGDEDEKKKPIPRSSPPSKAEDIRKRFSSVEDDEELSWDIDE
uniref:BSD domain-containing protein n=1 Tax=Oryza punctata TaxID=4537 RepID=A0A0E0JGY7_ORYPU